MKKFVLKFELKTAVNWLEDAIITISGPALAISGIIAGVDLVTGGNAMRNIPWLTLTWAICLLLTLDFQVLALGARAHKVYLSDKGSGHKAFEIILACLVAASISYVSIQMQSIIARANAAEISIDVASAQMGINTIALIWERSALVLVLIFLSGWFREDEHKETPQTTPATVSPDVLNVLVERLDELHVTVQQLTNPSMPALPEQAESLPDAPIVTWHEDGKVDTVQFPGKDPVHVHERNKAPANLQPIYDDRFASKEQEIAAILARKPDASVQEVAQEAHCSERTAEKWINRLANQGGN